MNRRILNIRRDSTLPQQLMLPIECPRRRTAKHQALFATVYGIPVFISIAIILYFYSQFN